MYSRRRSARVFILLRHSCFMPRRVSLFPKICESSWRTRCQPQLQQRAVMCCSFLWTLQGGTTPRGRITVCTLETSYTCKYALGKAEVATLRGVVGKDKALMYIRRYRSLLWLVEFKPIEPWEGEWLWSCLSSQACALLRFGVWEGGVKGGIRTLDDKSPGMSEKELPLLHLVSAQ